MAPNGQKHVIWTIWDYLRPFWTTSGQACHVCPLLVLHGPFQKTPAHIIGGWRCPKLLQKNGFSKLEYLWPWRAKMWKKAHKAQKVYVKEASRFEWMVKASSGRRVWILCLSTSWFLRSSSCEKVSSFILLVVRRWDLYIVSYICFMYGTLKERRGRRNISV